MQNTVFYTSTLFKIYLKLQVRKVERYAESAQPESGLFAARFIPEGQLASFYRGWAKQVVLRLREFFQEIMADVVSNSKILIHQTWGPLFSPPL